MVTIIFSVSSLDLLAEQQMSLSNLALSLGCCIYTWNSGCSPATLPSKLCSLAQCIALLFTQMPKSETLKPHSRLFLFQLPSFTLLTSLVSKYIWLPSYTFSDGYLSKVQNLITSPPCLTFFNTSSWFSG